MALLSAANLLSSVSLFHLIIAYVFLVSPSLISDQNLVYILGEAMGLVSRTKLDRYQSHCNMFYLLQGSISPLTVPSDLVLFDFHVLKTFTTPRFPFG